VVRCVTRGSKERSDHRKASAMICRSAIALLP
jgi:hypothetical protein